MSVLRRRCEKKTYYSFFATKKCKMGVYENCAAPKITTVAPNKVYKRCLQYRSLLVFTLLAAKSFDKILSIKHLK